MYFNTLNTVDQIKAKYRRLALENHPDRGGDTATMQEINGEYQEALSRCNGQTSQGTDGKEHTYKYDAKTEKAIMDKISEIISARLVGIDIWLIGTWVWVDGDTKPHKKALGKGTEETPGLGLKWHGKRKKWYWHDGPNYRRYNQKASFVGMAATYGATHFKNEATENAVSA